MEINNHLLNSLVTVFPENNVDACLDQPLADCETSVKITELNMYCKVKTTQASCSCSQL